MPVPPRTPAPTRNRIATAGDGKGRRSRAIPLAELVVPCLAPVLAKQGFAASDIVMCWPEIAGERLAAVCEPVKLRWPPRARGSSPDGGSHCGTLVVRVEGAFALELQHMTALLVERINAHLGWRCVDRIALRQAPLLRKAQPRRSAVAPDPDAAARAAALTSDVGYSPLREALERLGGRVFSRTGR